MAYQWFEFESRGDLAASLGDAISTGIAERLAAAPRAGFIAAGGTTAPPVLQRIAAARLDWPRLCVTLSDERWVKPSDPASNEKMVRDNLLQGPASAARFFPIYQDSESPEAAEPAVNERLASMPWQDSLCLLGMGRDGHVASLFPGTAALVDALNPAYAGHCKAVRPVTTEVAGPHPRMTLTLGTLTQARHIYLVITGADKREAFNRARGEGAESDMPVRAVLRQSRAPVSVYWTA